MKSKYIKEFNQTGICILDTKKVIKDWYNAFFIATYIRSESDKTYTFVIDRKRFSLKVSISEQQALEIVNALGLIHVKSTALRSAGVYRSKENILCELERITKIKHEKEFELKTIERVIFELELAL